MSRKYAEVCEVRYEAITQELFHQLVPVVLPDDYIPLQYHIAYYQWHTSDKVSIMNKNITYLDDMQTKHFIYN